MKTAICIYLIIGILIASMMISKALSGGGTIKVRGKVTTRGIDVLYTFIIITLFWPKGLYDSMD